MVVVAVAVEVVSDGFKIVEAKGFVELFVGNEILLVVWDLTVSSWEVFVVVVVGACFVS